MNSTYDTSYTFEPLQMYGFSWFLIILLLSIWLIKIKRISFIHESGLALLYGAVVGVVIKYSSYIKMNTIEVEAAYPSNYEQIDDQNSSITKFIFYVLLPPIIFNAGYSVNQKLFFKNFGAIILYAFIGTIISCFVFGGVLYLIINYSTLVNINFTLLDCLLFGAIISATDPITTLAVFNSQKVDMDVYCLIFGESILNDVASIVLTKQIETYVISERFELINIAKALGNFVFLLFGAFIIGTLTGFFNAFLTKYTKLYKYPHLETILFITISYSSYLLSEVFQLTGIVTILICGFVQSHYTYKNLSAESQHLITQILELLNFISDNLIFIYIGYSVFTLQSQQWVFLFIVASFFSIFIARAVNIYPLSFFINLTRSKKHKISFNRQNLLFFSGLRGAMSFCLSIKDTSTKSRQLILTTTSIIVIVTVLFNGGLTKKAIRLLRIKTEEEALQERSCFIQSKNWRTSWKRFDQSFILPLLTNYQETLKEITLKNSQPIAELSKNDNRINNNNMNHKINEPNDSMEMNIDSFQHDMNESIDL